LKQAKMLNILLDATYSRSTLEKPSAADLTVSIAGQMAQDAREAKTLLHPGHQRVDWAQHC